MKLPPTIGTNVSIYVPLIAALAAWSATQLPRNAFILIVSGYNIFYICFADNIPPFFQLDVGQPFRNVLDELAVLRECIMSPLRDALLSEINSTNITRETLTNLRLVTSNYLHSNELSFPLVPTWSTGGNKKLPSHNERCRQTFCILFSALITCDVAVPISALNIVM